jgi:prepilin-type N-terminal cleavage/methylation domain-containing protein
MVANRLRFGFTLVEIMVGMILGGMVLVGVLSAYLFFCRTGMGIAQYSDMETQSRVTMQRFGQDVRQAKTITWVSEVQVRFTYDDTTFTVYTYDANSNKFVRSRNNLAGTTLASGIESFAFRAYSYANAAAESVPSLLPISTVAERTQANSFTSMVQIKIVLRRNAGSGVNSSAQAVSSSYVLRNKIGT